ncbi:hypothetical protein ABE504_20300 [Paenibacillus oryzisoli]|uniref:hypothetical protein n=1 Tax=Paenibacillus oryzisoli TaxID=1850517 RepID=UPI003D265579
MRMFSWWAKTTWKRDMYVAGLQAVLFTAILLVVSQPSGSNNLSEYMHLTNAISTNLNELNQEPGITRMGVAGNGNERLIKVGIGWDHDKVTEARMKELIDRVLSHAAASYGERDWQQSFLTYTLKIEEIVDTMGGDGKVMAEKPAGTTELVWSNSFR